ncbi:hypothetical protein VI817_006290 [Penicillium citrinum]|nr:hypothetical protein VI817_006290 [Penicillium citrinum]
MFQGLITTFLVYWIGWIIYARFFHPLHKIPGPFLSSISRAWLVYKSARGDMECTQRALHKRYGISSSHQLCLFVELGHLARIAPNEISISGPSEIKGFRLTLEDYLRNKTTFKQGRSTLFETFNKVNKGYEGHFQSCDEKSYTERRCIVNCVYSIASVLEPEDAISPCMQSLCESMREFSRSKSKVDLAL